MEQDPVGILFQYRFVERKWPPETVFILNRSPVERLGCTHTVLIINANSGPRSPLFGSNQDNPVTSPGAVEGGCIGTLQHVETFNIRRIDIVDSTAPVPSGFHIRPARRIFEWHTVHDYQRLVIAKNRIYPANNDTGSTALHAISLNNIDTGHTSRQTGEYIGAVRFDQRIAVELLSGITQRAGLPFYPESRNNGLLEQSARFVERNFEYSLPIDGDNPVVKSHQRNGKCIISGTFNGKFTLNIGDSTGTAFLNGTYRSSDDWFTT